MISYIIWDIKPEIFQGFEFLRWYGIFWALGIILAYQVMLKIYKKEGLPSSDLDKLTNYLVFGIIIGARLGHVLFYDPIYYLNNPIEILPIKINPTFQFTGLTGLASHGGILGTLIALFLYKRKYKIDYLWILDRLIIAGSLLGGFIRLGNLINSEIIGVPTQLPWAFVFTQIDQIPRHPAQLYEAIFYLIISFILFVVWRYQKVSAYKGFLFGLGMFLIFAQRFLVEFVKENQVAFEESLKLNMGQTLSIPIILAGIIIMAWSMKNADQTQ